MGVIGGEVISGRHRKQKGASGEHKTLEGRKEEEERVGLESRRKGARANGPRCLCT